MSAVGLIGIAHSFIFVPLAYAIHQVYQLPEANVETLKLLMAHLKVVADNCDKNKVRLQQTCRTFERKVEVSRSF